LYYKLNEIIASTLPPFFTGLEEGFLPPRADGSAGARPAAGAGARNLFTGSGFFAAGLAAAPRTLGENLKSNSFYCHS
jgi:hypothetical protein